MPRKTKVLYPSPLYPSTSHPPIKAVIFDFDGTLADTMMIVAKSVNQHAEKFGYRKIDLSLIRDKRAIDVIKQDMGISLWKVPYLIWRGKKIIQKELQQAKLFPGVMEMIQALQEKYMVAILTSNRKDTVQHVLDKHKVKIPSIYSSGLFRKHRSLQNILDKLDLQPDEVIYVGDELRDIEACRKVGIKIISVSWGYNSPQALREAGADFIAGQPEDVVKIMNHQQKLYK